MRWDVYHLNYRGVGNQIGSVAKTLVKRVNYRSRNNFAHVSQCFWHDSIWPRLGAQITTILGFMDAVSFIFHCLGKSSLIRKDCQILLIKRFCNSINMFDFNLPNY